VEYRKLDVIVLPASGTPISLRRWATVVRRLGKEMMHYQEAVSLSRAKIKKKDFSGIVHFVEQILRPNIDLRQLRVLESTGSTQNSKSLVKGDTHGCME
jgi:hypothetical protein